MDDLDFTSALYLGLAHPSHDLPAWSQFTTGAPAVIREPMLAREVAVGVAGLIGGGSATAIVASSTLHLSFDLFTMLAGGGGIVYADASLYPIAAWGIERAAAHGARIRTFPAHDASTLRYAMGQDAPFARAAIVVTDGICPSCGRIAPLDEYLRCARSVGGVLVVDDTQALGVLGVSPDRRHPYGFGGGGTLRQLGLNGPDVVTMVSLAKAFGAPVAALVGSPSLIKAFRRSSETRVHCSPPSIPALLAAHRALSINARFGDALRSRLAARVGRFRAPLVGSGLLPARWPFPVQSIRLPRGASPITLQQALAHTGVQAVLTQRHGGGTALTFVITAAHSERAIDRATRSTLHVFERAGLLAPSRARTFAHAS